MHWRGTLVPIYLCIFHLLRMSQPTAQDVKEIALKLLLEFNAEKLQFEHSEKHRAFEDFLSNFAASQGVVYSNANRERLPAPAPLRPASVAPSATQHVPASNATRQFQHVPASSASRQFAQESSNETTLPS
mmetsp:Transcript_6458/g.11365  ORF Transcript_6458/g.11365 Transcript_6458/m.11365 type:complete len:131 (-) Transcript_6458:1959-2351(-)